MATLFDLPAQDVLFTHIFAYLQALDIWTLRLASKRLHELCWDYFINVCTSLTVVIQPPSSPPSTSHHPPPPTPSALGVCAGSSILTRSNKISNLEVVLRSEVPSESGDRFVRVLLTALTASDCELQRLCLRGVNLGTLLADPTLRRHLPPKCSRLSVLELCGPWRREKGEALQPSLLQLMVCCSGGQLESLTIQCLEQPLNQPPLPVQDLTGLRHISLACCQQVSSEGCLEEVFRKCPLLEVVDLRQVRSVSDRTLLVAREYCHHLKTLLVKGCPLVSTESLISLQDAREEVYMDVPLNRTRQPKGKKIPGQI